MGEGDLLEAVVAFVGEYERTWGDGVSLNVLNRRFGLRCQRELGGETLRRFVERNEGMFARSLGKSGGVIVRLVPEHPLRNLILGALMDGPGSAYEIGARLKGCGYTMGDLFEQLDVLRLRGAVRLENETFSLPE